MLKNKHCIKFLVVIKYINININNEKENNMWFEESVIYQIYPLGFCGAPHDNDGVESNRILKILDVIPHLEKLNINAVYFCPLFESSSHGYDTKDFSRVDKRLGSNEDFNFLCKELHKKGIKIILDGVFNHVGREFFAFRDVIENKWESIYKDWFYIDFNGNSNYNDGFWYEGWEGHYELVKLNLENPEVKNYLLDRVGEWIDAFDIDGLRLDVAYMLNRSFIKELRSFTNSKKSEFFLAGEIIHGNYKELISPELLDSCTNYECFKGIYSSFNSENMFEIAHSLKNRFGKEPWCMYQGLKLINFVDNHDVTRLASNLVNEKHLIPSYGILMAMPGIPCIYYGSEWGVEGKKEDGSDYSLRPCFEHLEFNELTDFLSQAIRAHRNSEALCYGSIEDILITNKQFIFERKTENERVIIMINADCEEYVAHFNANAGCGRELITDTHFDFGGGSIMPPYSVQYIKTE